MTLFGIDMAARLNAALGPKLLPFTLIRRTESATLPAKRTDGLAIAERRFPCRGIVESYRDDQVDGNLVRSGDRRILILGGSLPAGTVLVFDAAAVDVAKVPPLPPAYEIDGRSVTTAEATVAADGPSPGSAPPRGAAEPPGPVLPALPR